MAESTCLSLKYQRITMPAGARLRMHAQSSIAVVILNWNKAELTKRAVEVARSTTARNPHWIVVDNGSTVPIGGLPPDVTLIRNSRNLGFAGGVNTGIRHAIKSGADYIWLLNNDAEPTPGALDALMRAVENDQSIGLASPIILNSDKNDEVDWHGSIFQNSNLIATADPATYDEWSRTLPGSICLTGTALLVSRRLIETIGEFDEKLFAYWEDTDISLRAHAAGFSVVVVPDSAVSHACGTDEMDAENRAPYYYYLMTRNELILLRKVRAPWRARYWMLRRAVRWWRKPGLKENQRSAILRGIADGIANRGGPAGR